MHIIHELTYDWLLNLTNQFHSFTRGFVLWVVRACEGWFEFSLVWWENQIYPPVSFLLSHRYLLSVSHLCTRFPQLWCFECKNMSKQNKPIFYESFLDYYLDLLSSFIGMQFFLLWMQLSIPQKWSHFKEYEDIWIILDSGVFTFTNLSPSSLVFGWIKVSWTNCHVTFSSYSPGIGLSVGLSVSHEKTLHKRYMHHIWAK